MKVIEPPANSIALAALIRERDAILERIPLECERNNSLRAGAFHLRKRLAQADDAIAQAEQLINQMWKDCESVEATYRQIAGQKMPRPARRD